jgi:hypothetical protein
VGLHLLALLVLGTAAGAHRGLVGDPNFKRGAEGRAPRDPAMEVMLIRLPEPAGQIGSRPIRKAPPPKPATPPREVQVATSPLEPDGAPAPDQPAIGAAGVDELYRAPFRDAAGQAYASLRGRLGCAHVDLASLPAPVRALCDAAIKLASIKAGTQDVQDKGRLGPSAPP